MTHELPPPLTFFWYALCLLILLLTLRVAATLPLGAPTIFLGVAMTEAQFASFFRTLDRAGTGAITTQTLVSAAEVEIRKFGTELRPENPQTTVDVVRTPSVAALEAQNAAWQSLYNTVQGDISVLSKAVTLVVETFGTTLEGGTGFADEDMGLDASGFGSGFLCF